MENTAQSTSPKYVTQWEGFKNCKCPRCRVGNVFNGATYSFKGDSMNIRCPHCDLKFEREPGYFYVAMFVSYAMNVAEIIAICVAAYVFGLALTYENLWYYVGVIFVGAFAFAPFNYRYSRMALLYWLSPGLSYNPDYR
jgi:uncharacterized protein (DUF983 family)